MSNLSLTYEQACTILKVSPEDTEEVVRHSYFKMRKEVHPDMNNAPNANVEFQKVQLAFAVWKKGPSPVIPSPSSRVYKSTKARRAEHAFFKDYKTANTEKNDHTVSKKPRPAMDTIEVHRKFQIGDLLKDHEITIHDVNWKECTQCKAIGCSTCNYQGYKQIPWTKIIHLSKESKWFEPIIHYMDDRKIRIVIDIEDHEFYRLDQYDLHGTVEVTCLTAMVGTIADVSTLDSTQSIEIPPGTQPGQLFYIRNHGLYKPDGTRGNIVLKAHVTIPTIEHPTLANQVYELEKIIETPSLLIKKKTWWPF